MVPDKAKAGATPRCVPAKPEKVTTRLSTTFDPSPYIKSEEDELQRVFITEVACRAIVTP